MSITVQTVLTTMGNELNDPTNIYWSQAELIDYIFKGMNQLASLKPDTVATTATLSFTATSRQVIPTDGFLFLDLPRMLSPAASAIREIEMNHLDHADPNWYQVFGSIVLHFMFDPRLPLEFYVYPIPPGASTGELKYAKNPPLVTAPSDVLLFADIYQTPLVYYGLGLAFAKNTKRQDLSKSQFYFSMFGNFIGQKMQNQIQFSPRVPSQNSTGGG